VDIDFATTEVRMYPALCEYAFATKSTRFYALALVMRLLSSDNSGVKSHDVVRACAALGWRKRSTVFGLLRQGQGIWWRKGTNGRFYLGGFGWKNQFRRFGLSVGKPPRLVPLSMLENPEPAMRGCIFSGAMTKSKPISRLAIKKKTGLNERRQRQLENGGGVQAKATYADLDNRFPNYDPETYMDGVFEHCSKYRLYKKLPNQYVSPFPETNYGQISGLSRAAGNSRRKRAHGQELAGREPRKRYFDTLSAARRAEQPVGLAPDEIKGAMYAQVDGIFVIREFPVIRHSRNCLKSPTRRSSMVADAAPRARRSARKRHYCGRCHALTKVAARGPYPFSDSF